MSKLTPKQRAKKLFVTFSQSPSYFIDSSLSLQNLELNPAYPIALDIETDDLYGPIVSAQFKQSCSSKTYIVFAGDNPFTRDELIDKLIGHTVIIQNSSYEMSCISTQDRCDVWTSDTASSICGQTLTKQEEAYEVLKKANKIRVIDTMLLGRLAYPQFGQGLEELYTYVLGIDPFNSLGIDKKTTAKSFNFMYMSTKQEIYAALDVHFLELLYDATKTHINAFPYKLDIKATIAAIKRLTFSGYPVVRKTFQKLKIETALAIDERQLRLGGLNVNSPKQCCEILGSSTSGKYTLMELEIRNNSKVAKDIRLQRSDLKKFSLYFDKYEDPLETNHNDTRYDTKDFFMIYGNFSFGAKSGRGQCSRQNLQQVNYAI